MSAHPIARGLAAVTAVLAVAVAAFAGAADAGSRRRPCQTAGRTIAANAQARVYRVSASDADYKVHVCLERPARSVFLGAFDVEALGVRAVSLSGPTVAYERVVCDRADCTGAIRVRNLRTGVTRQSRIPSGANPATAVVASSRGAVAWIRRPSPGVVEVRGLGAGGERLLESGPGVDERSLAIAGSTVYWTRDGAPYSAPLP